MSPVTSQPVRDLLTKTAELNDTLLGGGEMQLPLPLIYVLGLFHRCCSTLGAIRLLLSYDFVHEAIVLARPLFTDSLALAEISASDEKTRLELAVRMVMAANTDGEGLFKSAKADGDDVDEDLAKVAEERSLVEKFARRNGLDTKVWRPDESAKQLAKKHGRAGEYLDLLVANQFVHGSMKAIEQRLTKLDGGTFVIGDPAAGFEPWADSTGLFAVHSSLCAARAATRIFGWTEPPELEALMAELADARAVEAQGRD